MNNGEATREKDVERVPLNIPVDAEDKRESEYRKRYRPRTLAGEFNLNEKDIKHSRGNDKGMRGFEEDPQVDTKLYFAEQSGLLKAHMKKIKDKAGRERNAAEATTQNALAKLESMIKHGVRSPTVDEFEAFVASMNRVHAANERGPMAESSKANYYQVMNHWAQARDMAPLPRRRFNIVERCIMPPTDKDAEKMITAAPNPRDRCIVAFAVGTGLRRKELRWVKTTDIITTEDGVAVKVTDRGQEIKSKKERLVPILDVAMPHLNMWLTSRARYLSNHKLPDPGWLFITLAGEQMADMTMYKSVRKAKKAAGVQYEGAVHGCRRYCLTQYGVSGIDIGMVQDIAGHADINTTKRYQKYNSQHIMAAARQVNKTKGW